MPTPRADTSSTKHTLAAAALVSYSALLDVRAGLAALLCVLAVLALLGHGRARIRTRRVAPAEGGPWAEALARAGTIELVELAGPLLFLSTPGIDRLLAEQPPWPRYLIIDLRGATTLDASALRALGDVLDRFEEADGSWLLLCAPHQPIWRALDGAGLSARALGGTACFTLAHGLERIARRHPAPPFQEEEVSRAVARPCLHLVWDSASAGE
jgi:MFS superfamily sulfate permease-like transporter